MFFLIILLSYILGCASTIALLAYLYIRYGLKSPVTIIEEEQYPTFHPITENDRAANSAVDTVNYLVNFLFQEMRDTSRLRRYMMRKLNIEFNELKNTRIGKLLLQDIVIQSFSLGKECPTFSDIQLERQERDERHLIKEFAAKLNADYKDGFSVTLDITLAFGHQCQLFIKVKRIQGRLHLEFRREPFSHWLLVFQDEPFMDLEVKSYFSTRESPQLAQIITQQLRRAIRRKQTWPSYKIRYQPFFHTSKQALPTEVLSTHKNNIIPGTFDISIKHCDRLSIPFEIFSKEKSSLLSVFLTINVNVEMCQDYLLIHRDQWPRKTIELIPQQRISIKEVSYMNRREFLIEELDPIPNEIEDITAFKVALEEKNIFLLQMQGQDIKTMRQIHRVLKYKANDGNEEKIQIVFGIPLLHSVRIPRPSEMSSGLHERQSQTTESTSTTVRQRITDRQTDVSEDSVQQQDSNISQTTTSEKTSSSDDITVIMMDADILQDFQARPTPTRKAEAYVKFDNKFEFQVGPNEKFLNICLWCKPPLDCGVPNVGKKLILLGYATVALSKIVLDAHMSYKRETQITLNFRSAYSSKANPNASVTDSQKKIAELSTHKNYDDNMTHGFVTINIKHQPAIEIKSQQEEKKEQISPTDLDKKKHEETESKSPSLKPTDHIFDDQPFSVGALCAYCNKKIWIKAGRQCRDCSLTVHKKCEDKFNTENICTHEPIHLKSPSSEDENSILSTKSAAAATTALSVIDSTARRAFGNKNPHQTPTLTLSELTKSDELISNALVNSIANTEKRFIHQPTTHTSSKLVNAASSAYSKFREFKTKRLPIPEIRKTRSPSDSAPNENISEADLQEIITRCLSDEIIDFKGLEDIFREKAIDASALFAKANQLGPELFRELPLDERKQKLDGEISRLQQEIDLQSRIRDEIIIEFNHDVSDENEKRKIQAKIANIEEKIQALGALTILYCSGLRHCCSEMEAKGIINPSFSDNDNSEIDDNSYKQ